MDTRNQSGVPVLTATLKVTVRWWCSGLKDDDKTPSVAERTDAAAAPVAGLSQSDRKLRLSWDNCERELLTCEPCGILPCDE